MSNADAPAELPKSRLIAITLDEKSTATTNSNIEHEREVAIFDILEGNSFALEGRDEGPYKLNLALVEDRLVLAVANDGDDPARLVALFLVMRRSSLLLRSGSARSHVPRTWCW